MRAISEEGEKARREVGEASPVIVATIRTGPSGQIWDLIGKLKKDTYYGLVEIGPVRSDDDRTDADSVD